MEYLRHIPIEMNEITEYKELDKAAKPTFETLDIDLSSIEMNHYLSSLNAEGCSRMEKIMGLDDGEGLDLDSRRLLIISKANNTLPYTIYNLKTKIKTLLGNDAFIMTMDYNNYHLKIVLLVVNFKKLNYVKENIEGMIPCNIILTLLQMVNTYGTFKEKKMTYGDMHKYTHSELRTEYFGG